jgi:hypothetical protein
VRLLYELLFTYTGKDTRFITKLFKEFNINISYRTRNTIGNILTNKRPNNNPYDEIGVYRLKCQKCSGVYIGQTRRNFKTRYKEHIQDIKSNNSKTGFSHHILSTGHAYDNIENTLEVLNFQEKGNYLNTLERFHIYTDKKQTNYLTTPSIQFLN